jgi:hypothetical protein
MKMATTSVQLVGAERARDGVETDAVNLEEEGLKP